MMGEKGSFPPTVLVKHTATWVVEVPRVETRLGTWEVRDVRDAVALCNGCEWSWSVLDPEQLTGSDRSSLAVWKEYRDGKKAKSDD